MAESDGDDQNNHVPDPWDDYTGYTDEDGMYVIQHTESSSEWIAYDGNLIDRRDIR